MHLKDGLLTPFWLALGWGLALPALFYAWTRVNWSGLGQDKRMNTLVLALPLILLLWTVKAGIYPGLNVHLLGGMLLTLMFGPWFAMMILAAMTLLWTALGLGGWLSLGVNLLTLTVVPVLVAFAILRTVERRLPGHFFIYIFIVAFIGSALTMAALSGVSTLFLLGSKAYSLSFLVDNWLISMVLAGWGEALTTGMLITLLVVYHPQFVSTFDDNHYLKGK